MVKKAKDISALPKPKLDEQELIALLQYDLTLGIGTAYEAYKEFLGYVAHNVLDDTPRLAHLAEDTVQEGFINALKYLREKPELLTDPKFRLRGWLAAIVRNQALAVLKTGKAHIVINAGVTGQEMEDVFDEGYITHYGDPMIFFEREQEKREAHQTVYNSLAALPPTQRAALEQKYLLDPRSDGKTKTDQQTAQELGLPLETVKSQIKRGKDQMSRVIEEQATPVMHPYRAKKTS